MQHVWPTWSASPANAGTVKIEISFDRTWEEDGCDYAQREYTYTAEPAVGYEFVEFRIQTDTAETYNGRTEPWTTNDVKTYSPYTSGGYMHGGSFWTDWRPAGIDYYVETLSISVVAVFRLVRTGLLVYMPANGQLIYDPNRNGALVYDG